MSQYNLNLLLQFCKQNGLCFTAFYGEASDELDLEVCSAADIERFHMKRVPTVEYFIEQWKLHVEKALESEEGKK